MPYSEMLIRPMREDLTRLGVEETRRPEDVDEAIRNTDGTVMVIVNSVCGCAAGRTPTPKRTTNAVTGNQYERAVVQR